MISPLEMRPAEIEDWSGLSLIFPFFYLVIELSLTYFTLFL